jgi:hypothetical protein
MPKGIGSRGREKRLRLAALAGPVSLEVVTENFLQFFFADNRSALAGDLTYLINSGRHIGLPQRGIKLHRILQGRQ